jgi:predicted secreted protein
MRLRSIILAVALAAAAPAAGRAEIEVPESVETSVGQMVLLKLPGNPRAGYRWLFNKEQSTGLEFVTVDPIGWIMAPEGHSIFFSDPSIMNIAIERNAAGEAAVAFDYLRTWGNVRVVRTITVKVIVQPVAKTTPN